MEPKFEVQLKILKPVSEVFAAVVDPRKLSGYFVKSASAPPAAGATVKWSFHEVPGEHPVRVREVVPNDRIVFEWESQEGGYDTRVEMSFKALEGGATMVQIRESGWRDTPEGREGLLQQLRRLDAHGLLPQGVPRVRHQPARRGRLLISGVASVAPGMRFEGGVRND